MIIPQQPIHKVDRLIRDIPLVLRRHEPAPLLARVPAEDLVVVRVELDVVLVEVGVELVRAEDFGDLD